MTVSSQILCSAASIRPIRTRALPAATFNALVSTSNVPSPKTLPTSHRPEPRTQLDPAGGSPESLPSAPATLRTIPISWGPAVQSNWAVYALATTAPTIHDPARASA